jgi:hypothetical protein
MEQPQQSSSLSAVSWPAIIAGAFVAASVSLVLLTLGTGLGFASIAPWPGHGMSVKTFAVTTAIWLIVMQWISSGVGGYIAGRLRTRWIGTHTHEVFFRDTAHGLVTWAVATVLVAATLATSLGAVERHEHGAWDASASLHRADAASRADDAAGAAQSDAAAPDEESARKAAAEAALYTALSMLVGAFIASVAAALGGRLRDEHL